MADILITGANGQLGSELRELTGQNTKDRFIFTDVAELDITDKSATNTFFSENEIGIVINCAAYTAVDKAEEDEDKAMLINAASVGYMAEACNRCGAALIHISTDYVYDGHGYMPYREDHPVAPASAYGRSKLAGEVAALKCINSVVIRTSWLYSTYGNNFVKTMLRLGKERDTLNVVFDQVGTPTYAADLAEAIMAIVADIQKGNIVTGIFHYSNEGVCSWYDFAHEIMHLAGLGCDVKPIETKDYPTPATRPHYSVLNKGRIKDSYGIRIPHWKDSLEKCIELLRT